MGETGTTGATPGDDWLSNGEQLVEKLTAMGSVAAARAYAEAVGTAETDTADKVKAVVEGQKKSRAKKSAPTGLSREIKEFCRLTDMTLREFTELVGKPWGSVKRWVQGISLPAPDTVQHVRQTMKKYLGDLAAPQAPPKIEAVPPKVRKASARPSVELQNGDNLAPHLVTDGRTLHVFTLTPGGVKVSYVAAPENQ